MYSVRELMELGKVTPYDGADLFNKDNSKIAAVENPLRDFLNGIHPMKPDIFTDSDFIIHN
jgi:hypothetical protein